MRSPRGADWAADEARARTMNPRAMCCTALLIAVMISPSTAGSQAAKRLHRIGILSGEPTVATPIIQGLKAGLSAEGLEEGRDLVFDIRPTQGEQAAAIKLAAVVARGNPDVIVTVGEHEALATRLRDEAPGAYKDVHAVMRAQRELTRITRTLRPLLSYKSA